MEKVSIYINPRAGNGQLSYWKKIIGRILFRSELTFHNPTNFLQMKRKLKKDVENRVDLVISVGGDGTMNTIVQFLAGTDVALLVLPGGTANDFAKEMGAIGRVKEALISVRASKPEKIDLIKVNNKYLVTSGGIGLGAKVAWGVNKLRHDFPLARNLLKQTGKEVYRIFLAKELLFSRNIWQKIKIESESYQGFVETPVVMVNNQPQVAGSFTIAPFTRNNDGKFNVTFLTHPGRKELIQCIQKVVQGDYPANDPHLISFETDKIEFSSTRRVPFFGDGEILYDLKKYTIGLEPRALNVYRTECLKNAYLGGSL